MELFGVGAGLFAAGQAVTWGLVSILFPAFWVWMLIDAILRDQSEYPGGGENTKIVWVLLLALFHFVSVFYLFMVYAKVKRSPRSATGHVSVQAPPPAAPSA